MGSQSPLYKLLVGAAVGVVLKPFKRICEGNTIFVIILRQQLPFTLCWHLHWLCKCNSGIILLSESRQWRQTALLTTVYLQSEKGVSLRMLTKQYWWKTLMNKNYFYFIIFYFISSQLLSTYFLIFCVTKEVCVEHFCCIPKHMVASW